MRNVVGAVDGWVRVEDGGSVRVGEGGGAAAGLGVLVVTLFTALGLSCASPSTPPSASSPTPVLGSAAAAMEPMESPPPVVPPDELRTAEFGLS